MTWWQRDTILPHMSNCPHPARFDQHHPPVLYSLRISHGHECSVQAEYRCLHRELPAMAFFRNKWDTAFLCLAVAAGLFLLGTWFPSLTGQAGYAGVNKPKYRKILSSKFDCDKCVDQSSQQSGQTPQATSTAPFTLTDPADHPFDLTAPPVAGCPLPPSQPAISARAPPAHT